MHNTRWTLKACSEFQATSWPGIRELEEDDVEADLLQSNDPNNVMAADMRCLPHDASEVIWQKVTRLNDPVYTAFNRQCSLAPVQDENFMGNNNRSQPVLGRGELLASELQDVIRKYTRHQNNCIQVDIITGFPFFWSSIV